MPSESFRNHPQHTQICGKIALLKQSLVPKESRTTVLKEVMGWIVVLPKRVMPDICALDLRL